MDVVDPALAEKRAKAADRVRRYRARHPDRIAAYAAANRDKTAARSAKWAAQNRDKAAAHSARYRTAHPERVAAYRAANRARAAVGASHRRAARYGALVNDLTVGQWLGLLEAADHLCTYCGAGGKLEMDHAFPLARGGDNTAANVVPACPPCNQTKHNRTLGEWLNP